MPLLFGTVCDLLQRLEYDLQRKRSQKGPQQIVTAWFAEHRLTVDHDDTDKCALLSTLLPERRTDRVFFIKHKTLSAIFARAHGLGITRKQRLTRYETPGSGVDLAECIEEILKETPNFPTRVVTVEDVDRTLHQLATGVAFSSPAIRSSGIAERNNRENREALGALFRSLSARDAKWFTRLVLKSYLPVVVPEYVVYAQCNKILPTLLKIHDDFPVAVRLLNQQTQNGRMLDGDLDKAHLPRLIKPQVGVKVGRQTWLKGRSIKHCLEIGSGLMSVEKKMDGEYCQVHIDLSKGPNCIQIFSKSAKDSTADRFKLHAAIKSSLGIGTSSCGFRRQCILEGEMVVYSHKDERILGFEKIRKHVSRTGRFLGTDEDSQAHDYERLMIVYFDVLLVDDDSLLNVRHSERHRRLSRLIHCHNGKAALVERQIINFSSRIAAEELREAFALCIINREEGLVLKPDEPYFDFGSSRRKYASCCVKLKKGFIKKMGDVGDFAVVGARYDASRAKVLNLPEVKYTHFYLGCLTNSEKVRRFRGVMPEFTIINEVEVNAVLLQYFQRYCFTNAVAFEENDVFTLNISPGLLQGKRIATVFKEPAVFEMTCFSFHKAPNTKFWSLRFPYVSKIHCDRKWQDCVGFEDLQTLAEEETTSPEKEDSQELAQWIEVLEQANPKTKKLAVGQHTQSTEATISTVSTAGLSSQHYSEQTPVRPALAASIAATESESTTPPASSTVKPERTASTRLSPRKRRNEASLSSPRRSRLRKEEPVVIDLTSSPPSKSHQDRQPLEDITSASSSQGNVLQTPRPRLPRTETFHEVVEKTASSHLPTHLSVSSSFPSSMPSPSPLKAPTASRRPSSAATRSNSDLPLTTNNPASSCRHAGGTCALVKHSILLSPCVASMPLLTEDLLPSHGVTAVFTDVASWLASLSLHTRSSRRLQTLVLVERRRHDATIAFLKQLEADPMRQQDGQPAVVLAYDWRLVEAVTDEETKYRKSVGGLAQLWKRMDECWRWFALLAYMKRIAFVWVVGIFGYDTHWGLSKKA
ncbi:DNA ligase 4 [Cytospora mali]|uniref:DNA ligase 4 n=1 Tax=Cytospora mali TaxID=578113 RepID=A0A194W6R9_CYTMA|nr:DNA ligase 4 [Valsa mali]